jgi:glycosyltransferase involved in cell wall biosynthesis
MPKDEMKKKLLLIGNAYYVKVNRRKAVELSEWFNVTVISHKLDKHDTVGRIGEESETNETQSEIYSYYSLNAKGSTQGGTKFILIGLAELIKNENPDIILIETEPWSKLFWQVVKAKKRHCKQAKMGLFSWENIRRPGIKGLVLDSVYRAAVKKLDFIIAGNREAKDLFIKAGANEKIIHIDAQLGFVHDHLPSDIKLHRLNLREKWSVNNNAIIIGYCGRFVKEKGVWDLLNAVEDLRNKYQFDLHLHFLGGGKLKEELKTYEVKKPWFTILGSVKHDEVVMLAG